MYLRNAGVYLLYDSEELMPKDKKKKKKKFMFGKTQDATEKK